MDENNNSMVSMNLNNCEYDRSKNTLRNEILVLVLYSNQQNVKDHHVHLEDTKTTMNINDETNNETTLFFRANEPRLCFMATVTMVSALDVEDDEGM